MAGSGSAFFDASITSSNYFPIWSQRPICTSNFQNTCNNPCVTNISPEKTTLQSPLLHCSVKSPPSSPDYPLTKCSSVIPIISTSSGISISEESSRKCNNKSIDSCPCNLSKSYSSVSICPETSSSSVVSNENSGNSLSCQKSCSEGSVTNSACCLNSIIYPTTTNYSKIFFSESSNKSLCSDVTPCLKSSLCSSFTLSNSVPSLSPSTPSCKSSTSLTLIEPSIKNPCTPKTVPCYCVCSPKQLLYSKLLDTGDLVSITYDCI